MRLLIHVHVGWTDRTKDKYNVHVHLVNTVNQVRREMYVYSKSSKERSINVHLYTRTCTYMYVYVFPFLHVYKNPDMHVNLEEIKVVFMVSGIPHKIPKATEHLPS